MCSSIGAGLAIPADYGWVLLSASIMSFACLLVGFIFAGGARAKVFTEEYMKKNFGQEHKKATGEEIKKGGYPDTGSGLYSSKLTYEQWYNLNNGQRAHYNFLQWISTNLTLLLISGLHCPKTAAFLGFGITISRIIYSIGYQRGPHKRVYGVLPNALMTLAQLVMSIMASLKIINSGLGVSQEL